MEIKITERNETDWRTVESWQCMEGETSQSGAMGGAAGFAKE